MIADEQLIVEELRKAGIEEGDVLLVHSSYKSLGEVSGGALTVVNALKKAVGADGTLMMPTFTFDYVNKNNPVFDVRYTKGNVGIIPEIFRNSENVVRSLHPTHSLAVWGKDKEWFVQNHHDDDTCLGINSPIYKLKENNGKILLLGCGLAKNTILHGLEIFCDLPYACKVDYSHPDFYRNYACVDENDCVHRKEFKHVFAQAMGYEHNFSRLADIVELSPVKILNAESYLFDAKKLWDDVKIALEKNPYALVYKI